MLFGIERDLGHEIAGYVISDSFVGQAEISVSNGGEELLRLVAAEPREAVRHAGRHETGLCGFQLDETNLPGLQDLDRLTIHEPESGLLIYRRVDPAAVVDRKVFRLETRLLPFLRLDRALQPMFRFAFPLIDRFGQETNFQMFLVNGNSTYISGRVFLKNFDNYIDQGFTCVTMLQDPYEELAERLLVLRLMASGASSYLGSRDAILFEDATAFAAGLPIESERDLRRAFRDVPISVATALGDPLMRQLTNKLPDEPVKPAHLGGALNTLSSFQVVGLRKGGQHFIQALAQTLGIDPDQLPPVEIFPVVETLAAKLRACPPVESLIENDLALHAYVRDAFEKSGSEG